MPGSVKVFQYDEFYQLNEHLVSDQKKKRNETKSTKQKKKKNQPKLKKNLTKKLYNTPGTCIMQGKNQQLKNIDFITI